jgi:hypothetical protein
MFEIKRMIEGKEPVLWFPDGEERSLLWRIKTDQFTPQEIVQMERDLREFILSKSPWTNLPEKAPIDILDKWVVNLRRRQMFEETWNG